MKAQTRRIGSEPACIHDRPASSGTRSIRPSPDTPNEYLARFSPPPCRGWFRRPPHGPRARRSLGQPAHAEYRALAARAAAVAAGCIDERVRRSGSIRANTARASARLGVQASAGDADDGSGRARRSAMAAGPSSGGRRRQAAS